MPDFLASCVAIVCIHTKSCREGIRTTSACCQVLEQRATLDTLEELQTASLVTTASFETDPFFEAVPELIQGNVSVHAFVLRLQAVLFPDSPTIAFTAC